MLFTPPRCPNRSCTQHESPGPGFFSRQGSYTPRCRSEPVPRFRCRTCRRGFSRQTFRQDYRDRRPDCNGPLFQLLASGVGLRQSGRALGLASSAVQYKMRKIARSCRWLQRTFAKRLPPNRTYILDEEESYECSWIRPLTVPIIVERESWFIVSATAGPIRRLAPRASKRRRRQDKFELEHGKRKDRSRLCVRGVLSRLAASAAKGPITLLSDEKSSYRTAAKSILGDRVHHATTPGSAMRSVANPLFPINATIMMSRDNNGRLRRKSWLATKRSRRLRAQLQIFMVYRNFVRQRFNRDRDRSVSSASWLGIVPRAMRIYEALSWRQDWGELSPHPLSFRGDKTVAQKMPDDV